MIFLKLITNTFSWGRASRIEYLVFNILFGIIFYIIDSIIEGNTHHIIVIPLVIFYVIALFTITARRLHDSDRSAWWMLYAFVPIVGGLVLVVVTYFFKGTSGANRFDSSDEF
jgi:uncharacterized membrane protein YhaH (DUF805 family)